MSRNVREEGLTKRHRASLQISRVGKFQANGRITNGLKKRVLFIVDTEVVRPQ